MCHPPFSGKTQAFWYQDRRYIVICHFLQVVAATLQPKVQEYLAASGASGKVLVTVEYADPPSAVGGSVSIAGVKMSGAEPVGSGACTETPASSRISLPRPLLTVDHCMSAHWRAAGITRPVYCALQVPGNLANLTVSSVPL